MSHLINFETLSWIEPAIGIRYKKYVNGNQQLRLVEFSEGFVELDWCSNGHAGYVVEGTFANDYNGDLEYYKAGDSFFITRGETDKHKVIMKKGERVLLLLFEINN